MSGHILNHNGEDENTTTTSTTVSSDSNENDTILDMTCHNNYVGDRCELLKRNYKGVDINEIRKEEEVSHIPQIGDS